MGTLGWVHRISYWFYLTTPTASSKQPRGAVPLAEQSSCERLSVTRERGTAELEKRLDTLSSAREIFEGGIIANLPRRPQGIEEVVSSDHKI